ncbi:hypothetical protein GWI33_003867 [Rhynchophorus ferrugineus]|uniref:Uncharacterized protein n=1 Tax=Rhynchophorus ferrugineus TaxID=354439 RepID=A0A834IYZ9_RHYFE|nr:hypothetical protein GWI33_003867 [Rhynchophorus ferrugineus]
MPAIYIILYKYGRRPYRDYSLHRQDDIWEWIIGEDGAIVSLEIEFGWGSNQHCYGHLRLTIGNKDGVSVKRGLCRNIARGNS